MQVYVVRKWPLQGKSRFVLEYNMSKSVVTVRRAFRVKYAKDQPTDKITWPADLRARTIVAVKNIDAPMLMRVCGKNLNIVLMCAITHGAHIEHLLVV
jgi:hypothetical protein